MLLYWSMFLIPLMASISQVRLERGSRRVILGLLGLLMIIIIGLRDHVGHDWNNYLRIFERFEAGTFDEVMTSAEPGYALVNWICSRMGWGIFGVNVICSTIFVVGLFAFAQRQPNFWRVLALATPVLIIVVSMAATRQAVAIGLLMLAFNAFNDRRLIRFLLFVALALLFHRTAVVFVLLAWFIYGRLSIWALVVGGLIFFVAGTFVLQDAMPYYQTNYVDAGIEAAGAIPRTLLNVVAAIAFLLFRRQWMARYDDGALYTLLAGAILVMAPAVFIQPVAVDRMGMYLIPAQIAIFARIPDLLPRNLRTPAVIATFVVFALVMGIWLNFSFFAQQSWLPYDNFIWSGGNAGYESL